MSVLVVRSVLDLLQRRLGFVTGILAGVIFLLDVLYPSGVVIGLLYVGPIFLTIWARRLQVPIALALACSALDLLGLALSPVGAAPWIGLLNRVLTLFAIWASAGLAILAVEAEVSRSDVAPAVEAPRSATADTRYASCVPGVDLHL